MQDSKIEISKIKRKKRHFPQIVEDCVSDCQRLSSARTRTRNSFSSFNPPLTPQHVKVNQYFLNFIRFGGGRLAPQPTIYPQSTTVFGNVIQKKTDTGSQVGW